MRKLIDWILNLLFPLPDIEGNWTNVRMRRLLGPIEGKEKKNEHKSSKSASQYCL